MRRRAVEEENDHHDRWMVSYADFITLMFAFFVVMYSISSVNEGKYRTLSGALGSAFGKDKTVNQGPGLLPAAKVLMKTPEAPDALKKERERMTGTARSIQDVLAPLVREGKVRVTQSARGVSVEIDASVLFTPGEAKLAPESSRALIAVAEILKDDTHTIQVEGNTDAKPISNALFASNWELSSARASSVVRLLEQNGVADSRMTVIGHGSTQPIVANDSELNRSRNRRVTVMILAEVANEVTEVPLSGSR